MNPSVDSLLELADDELILGWRNSEWTGIAPFLEEDVAFSSIAQNEIGHARALYEIVARELGTDADAVAFHVTLLPDSVPFAVPATCRLPAHVAVNVPDAVLPLCSVTFQRKFVQVVGDGSAADDVQLPRSAAVPVGVGLVELRRS